VPTDRSLITPLEKLGLVGREADARDARLAYFVLAWPWARCQRPGHTWAIVRRGVSRSMDQARNRPSSRGRSAASRNRDGYENAGHDMVHAATAIADRAVFDCGWNQRCMRRVCRFPSAPEIPPVTI